MKAKIRIAFLITISFLLVILSGCARSEQSLPVQNNTPASTTLTETKLDLEIGEVYRLPGMEATVLATKKTDNVSYGSGGQNIDEVAGEGNILVVAEFWIKNTGNKTIKFTNIPFGLRDNAGFNYNPMLYAGEDGIGLLNDSYPNQTKKGIAVYKVPVGARGFNFYLNTDNFIGPDFTSLPIKVKSISWWPR